MEAGSAVAAEIEMKGIGMDYGGGGQSPAVRDVCMTVRKGEFAALLGPSGCGKTTLLRMIADLLEPTSGEVRVSGSAPRAARLAGKLGMVFQTPALFEWRSVRANVELPLELAGVPRTDRRERSESLLRLVGLEGFGLRYPWQLSGGMQQRASIARALAMKPDILLMDEPFSALDEFTREKLNEELLSVWGHTGCTVVFVTHSIAEAVFLSDRVFVLSPRPGRLAAAVDIPLPRPRDASTRALPSFHELVDGIRGRFREASA
ncbi:MULTISPECIES: ABC transporter ATP-binding protein [Paenibacillus]|nr:MULTISPECIES: ABC transporter ATP-binding protein [Paenibacillus]KKC46622.1 sulfonate ABC transporter ATP-binding protein [Paenibacillus sp. D9]